MKVLLTGATGFLGSHVARELARAGHEVRALVRPTSRLDNLAGVPLERAVGDILDRPSVLRALEGADAVIHAAASTSARQRDRAMLFEVNVEGTRNVLEGALTRGVRVVYTSTIGAVGGATREPEVHDESVAWNLGGRGYPYLEAKRAAEEVAADLCARGLDVVTLNPGMILGPGDVHLSSVRYVTEYVRGLNRYWLGGGMSCGDVRDIARAHVAALERGRAGERYVLAGQNVSHRDLLERLQRLTGGKRPLRLPYALAWAAARASELRSRLGPHALEDLHRGTVWMGGHYIYFDCAKAAADLGYEVTDLDRTLRDTLADLLARGVIRPSTPELAALAAAAAAGPETGARAPAGEPAPALAEAAA